MDINFNFLLVAMKKCSSQIVKLVNKLGFVDHIVVYASIFIVLDAEYRHALNKGALLDILSRIKE